MPMWCGEGRLRMRWVVVEEEREVAVGYVL